jgi:hypothetical protein
MQQQCARNSPSAASVRSSIGGPFSSRPWAPAGARGGRNALPGQAKTAALQCKAAIAPTFTAIRLRVLVDRLQLLLCARP